MNAQMREWTRRLRAAGVTPVQVGVVGDILDEMRQAEDVETLVGLLSEAEGRGVVEQRRREFEQARDGNEGEETE